MNLRLNYLSPLASGYGRWRFFTSLIALLVLSVSGAQTEAASDFGMNGWATTGNGTTGGADGETVTASTPEEFVEYIARIEPLVIQINGTIDMGTLSSGHPGYQSNSRYKLESDKTLLGLGNDAHITRAEIRLSGKSNVIIRNIKFSKSPTDAVVLSGGTTNVWIDHNDFADCYDGLLDISTGSDLITVSWNRFVNHEKTTLVGSADHHTSDRGHLRVTYHHNWFFETGQRHPRVRYGRVHVYNNYYTKISSYGIGIGVEANIVSEANYMDGATRAWRHYDTSSQPGYFRDSGSILTGISNDLESTDDSGINWSPSDVYSYSVDPASDVPEIVMSGAGVGVITGTSDGGTDGGTDGGSGGEDPMGGDNGSVTVSSVEYSTWGGKNNDRHIQVILYFQDDSGEPVSGVSVAYTLNLDGAPYESGTATSDDAGAVTFSTKNAPSGTYTTSINEANAAGYAWDGVILDEGFVN